MTTTKAGPISADRLKSLIERIERLEEVDLCATHLVAMDGKPPKIEAIKRLIGCSTGKAHKLRAMVIERLEGFSPTRAVDDENPTDAAGRSPGDEGEENGSQGCTEQRSAGAEDQRGGYEASRGGIRETESSVDSGDGAGDGVEDGPAGNGAQRGGVGERRGETGGLHPIRGDADADQAALGAVGSLQGDRVASSVITPDVTTDPWDAVGDMPAGLRRTPTVRA